MAAEQLDPLAFKVQEPKEQSEVVETTGDLLPLWALRRLIEMMGEDDSEDVHENEIECQKQWVEGMQQVMYVERIVEVPEVLREEIVEQVHEGVLEMPQVTVREEIVTVPHMIEEELIRKVTRYET